MRLKKQHKKVLKAFASGSENPLLFVFLVSVPEQLTKALELGKSRCWGWAGGNDQEEDPQRKGEVENAARKEENTKGTRRTR